MRDHSNRASDHFSGDPHHDPDRRIINGIFTTGFFRTVLYLRDVSWIQLCPGFVLDLVFPDFSLENTHNPFVVEIAQVN